MKPICVDCITHAHKCFGCVDGSLREERGEVKTMRTVCGGGGHYSICEHRGMEVLMEYFPEAEANELNLALFSTSGVHGTYATIEDVEREGGELTYLIINPRLVRMVYGTCVPQTTAHFEFLKKLRQSSWDELVKIGKGGGK